MGCYPRMNRWEILNPGWIQNINWSGYNNVCNWDCYAVCNVNTEDAIRHKIALMISTSMVYMKT